MELGTPEAAVRACVGLLAQLFHLNESRLAYYLDLYWQVRQAYEKAEEEERRNPPPASPEPPLGKGAEEENADALPPEMSVDDKPNVFVVDPVEVGMSAYIPTDEDKASDDTVPPGFVVYEKPKAKEPDQGAPVAREPGPAAKAAMEKRKIVERLEKLRAGGLSVKKIVETANGAITDEQIRGILARERYGINVYRVLNATLELIAGS